MTASSDAEPTTEDQVAGGGAMAEAGNATSPSAPEVQPSQDGVRAAPSAVGSQPSTAIGEEDGDRRRPRIVVYARPPESWAEQPGASAEPKSDPKAEPERPSYYERARLNAVHSFYLGTLAGGFSLYRLYRLSYLQEGEEETPERKAEIELYRSQYEAIHSDLKKFETMAGFSNIGEAAVAFAGQFGASMLSPEGWIPSLKGGTLLVRALRGGLTQAGIQLATDPVVQWLSIKSRVQEGYDPVRTATGAAVGLAGGSATSALARPRVGRPAPSSPNPPHGGTVQPSLSNLPQRLTPRLASTANRAATGDKRVDVMTEAILSIMEKIRESPEFCFGSGNDFGRKVHAELAKWMKTLNISGLIPGGEFELVIEKNFLRGDRVDGSPLDSVRPDVAFFLVEKGKPTPLAIYDLKTGGADFPPSRVQELRDGVKAYDAPVIEIRSTETKLEAILK